MAHVAKRQMRKSNYALRIQPSLLEEARKLAEAEGVALNQLINVAVAEKVSALRTESYITERMAEIDRCAKSCGFDCLTARAGTLPGRSQTAAKRRTGKAKGRQIARIDCSDGIEYLDINSS